MGAAQQACGIVDLHKFHAKHGRLDGDRNGGAEFWLHMGLESILDPRGGALDHDFFDRTEEEGLHSVHLALQHLAPPHFPGGLEQGSKSGTIAAMIC